MIELRHIQELEKKVHSALELIHGLRSENTELKSKLEGYQGRIEELERLVTEFKEDQGAIEEGILRALKKLDSLEDSVTGAGERAQKGASPKPPVVESTTPPSDASDGAPEATEDASEGPENEDTPPEDASDEEGSDEEASDEDEPPDTGESELDIF